MQSALIQLQDVTLGSRDFGPISVEFRAGQLTLLCGLSGSGKSTLCQLLCERHEVSSGEIVRNPDLKYGYIAHDFVNQLIGSTVNEEIEIARRANPSGATVDDFDGALTALWERLEPLAGSDPHNLSAMEQQYLLLYCSLLAGARFLILDESLSHLDEDSASEFSKVLQKAREVGVSLLVVSHQETFLKLADQILLMEAGRLGFFGPVGEFTEELSVRAGFRELSEPRVFETHSTSDQTHQVIHNENSFSVSGGEMILLGGSAGSGKSYILNSLFGLAKSPHWNFRPTVTSACLLRQIVGPSFWRPTVRSEIAASASVFGKLSAETKTLLEENIPPEWLGKSPRQLSHGQLRYFGTLCMLWQNPKIVFLDLPFQGLDGILREKLWRILNQYLHQKGLIFMTTCSRDWINPSGQKGVWVDAREVVEFGSLRI